jgi:hypothetical protein
VDADYPVVVAAGSLRDTVRADLAMPHRWTDAGVVAETQFTGAHLLHLAAAACVLNDLFREADARGVRLDGVRVAASGGFDDEWGSTGIGYQVEVDSPADAQDLADLVRHVDEIAEIPRALRAGASVRRTS